MDMDSEVELFKKTQRPSLIGSSVRDSTDTLPTVKSIGESKRHIFTNNESHADVSNVDNIRAKGALVANEEDGLYDLLDNSGHIKDEAIPDTVKLKGAELKFTSIDPEQLQKLNLEEDKVVHSNDLTILGGNADQYVVPASGAHSGFKYNLKKKKGSDAFLNEHEPSSDFISDKMRSVDDIIEVVNKGNYEKAGSLIDESVAESVCSGTRQLSVDDVSKVSDPKVPNSAVEVDSEYTAPAAMREGSESRLLEEQRTRSSSKLNRPSMTRNDSSDRPNLARGDSYHSGLHDGLSISNSFDQSNNFLLSERRPRHDPNGSRVSNHSSLNYLRSISRSRSRMANDRKSYGGDDRLESDTLRETGALINDDAMSTSSDMEYAVNKALDFVEGTHSVKGRKNHPQDEDIVKALQRGLAGVAEEEKSVNGSNRSKIASNDILDQLADSAMELMNSDDDDDNGEENEETRDEIDAYDQSKSVDVESDNGDITLENIKKVVSCIPEESDVENSIVGVSNAKEKTGVSNSKEDETSKDEESITEDVLANEMESNEDVTNEKDVAHREDVKEELNVAENENELSSNEKVESPDPEKVNEEKEEHHITENEEHATEKIEEELGTVTDNDEETKEAGAEESQEEPEETVSVEEAAERAEPTEHEEAAEHEEPTGLEAASSGEEEQGVCAQGEVTEKENALETEPAEEATEQEIKEKEEVEDKEDDIEALIAAAAREKALNEGSGGKLGADGSVYVPKSTTMTFENEPVYLFTSFAGGFQVNSRTNRLVTILTANRVKFELRDLGTDEEAKKVWRRYSAGKTLPGIVRGKDDFIGNWEDIEEANENYNVRSLIYETV